MRSIRTTKDFLCCVLILVLVILLYINYESVNISTNRAHILDFYEDNRMERVVAEIEESDSVEEVLVGMKEDGKLEMKYILQWTPSTSVPFAYMGKGQDEFINRRCPYVNCFVTSDRSYLGDYTKFDVIAFNGPEVVRMSETKLPTKRSPHQKYAFATIESADNYPICSDKFNSFFNWTWTYKLDSEVRWGYMVIRDKNNNVVGPNKEMNWIKFEDMDPVNEEFRNKLKTKTHAVAWFVSNCHSRSKREYFVSQSQEELIKYGLSVDVYGRCGPLSCSRANETACDEMIKEKYHFYLSFENSFSEDYVTEKLLHAVENNVVPIVFGGADYNRFLPDGSYLNARELGAKELAKKVDELIKAPEKYAEYFRWKNHYSFHRKAESVDTDEYCLFCTILNNEHMVKNKKVYENFRQWWNPPHRC